MKDIRKRENIYCSGKRVYDKKSAITAKNKRFNEDKVELRVYPCGNHWHLTKRVYKRKPKRKTSLLPFNRKEKYTIDKYPLDD